MKNKKNEIVNLIAHFQKDILQNRPSVEEMIQDVRMMKFKVRPVDGDISQINFKNIKFIETLWNLGKLDDFFHKEYKSLSVDDQKIFTNFVDHVYRKYQSELNSLRLKQNELQHQVAVEIEIFKDKPLRN